MKKRIILIIILTIALGLLIVQLLQSYKKYYTNIDFNIDTYISSIDKDNDGIDDESDILANAKAYIAKRPIYRSKYYKSGYPNDKYGVCTDVVAFSLLNAGYNLMELVNEDITNNPDDYNIEIVDKRIDFRRVTNLKVYFDNTAIKLTTDINDITAWQGGDIVIFKKHIGIISNKRNQKGIPYVIHHASIYQLSYEEDILERHNDIVGHYRIS